jgi:GNAT superfamily N-acetyltransferase
MLQIAPLQAGEIEEIAAGVRVLGGNKPAAQYERYLAEQDSGRRDCLVARCDGAFCGYVTIDWQPDYPPFRDVAIPEIQDFNVLPDFRRRGIGTRLMDEAERRVFTRASTAGIGFGLHHDYGVAQRLYVRRGYVPDGLGITSHGRRVNWGDDVKIDDDLVLYLVKSKS